jgi:hypothetical protein
MSMSRSAYPLLMLVELNELVGAPAAGLGREGKDFVRVCRENPCASNPPLIVRAAKAFVGVRISTLKVSK